MELIDYIHSWDTREPKKPLRSIQASEKEILSVAWGASNENLIITGGADNVRQFCFRLRPYLL